MSLQEKEIKIKEIELELLKLKDDQEIDHTLQIQDLENTCLSCKKGRSSKCLRIY